MKICILSVEKGWETARLSEEARRLGHEAAVVEPGELSVDGLKEFNVLLVRDVQGQASKAMQLAGKAPEFGLKVFDRRLAVAKGRNKLDNYKLFAGAGLFVPHTEPMFRRKRNSMNRFPGNKVVVKLVTGKRGESVHLVTKKKFKELWTIFRVEKKKYLVQEFTPIEKELRVLVVGDKVLGSFEKKAVGWKGNIAQGAKALPHTLSDEEKQVALKAAKTVETDVAGVDLALCRDGRYFVLEVNRSPQFKAFESTTGLNAAKEIISFLDSAK